MIYFTGFNPSPLVRLPQTVFTDLLPIVDDLGELKATLAVLSLLSSQPGATKCVRLDDLLDHPALAGMGEAGVIEGLSKAVIRGTLLTVRAWCTNGQAQDLYFANTERGREAVAAIERGEWPEGLDAGQVERAEAQRPNIFVLYEQCVGSIASPVLADDLRDAEETYPADWIEEAFREAARHNARNWAYVRKILENRGHREKRGRNSGDVSAEWARFLRGEC